MKPTKSALVMILAAVLCFNSICTVFAAEESAEFKESQNIEMAGMDNIIMSGDCSATEDDHVTWALTGTDDEIVLSISGSGKMMGYEENQNGIPWWEKRNAINSVVINDGITNIGDEAFSYCINLTSVDLPEGLEEIGEEAFGSCKSLESITIPDSVISIGFGAFDACTNLKSINIPNNLTIIEDHVFAGCAFSSIDIPDSVTSIKCYAFTSCNNLTDVIIPDSVEIIEEFAFGDCSSLKSITIPDSVSSIGDFAFENCINLTSIMIPIDVTDIGNGVFNGCSNLLSIVVEEGNTNYCSSEGVLFNKNKTMLIEFPGGKNGVYSIPLTVTSVGDEAFYCCSNLTSVYFSGQAPSFGAGSFYNTVITAYFPENNASWTDSVKQNYGGEITWVPWAELSGICGDQVQWSISSDGTLEIRGYGPMYDYSSDSNDEKAPWDSYKTSITDILIGDGVTHIGSAAFFGCSNLESVSIAETVVSIGENAFSGSTSLGTVRYGGTKKQWENVSIGTGNNELKDAPSYVFIDGEEHNDPSEIASITPENGDENVDHSINRYIIQFKKDVEFTDEGYAYLFDSSNTSNPVETIALTSPSSKALLLSSIPGQHKQDIFQLMFQYKLEYGHHYYITIDKNALRFVTYDENIGDYVPTGKYFEGINGSAEWAFKICDIDYMHFNNPTDEILSSNYSILFKPLKAINIKAQDDGTHGTCFGWAYTVGAKEQSFYSISQSQKELRDLQPFDSVIGKNKSLLDYIHLMHLYQYTKRKTKELDDNENKYQKIYNAVLKHINGTGPKIVVCVFGNGIGHALYPLDIIEETGAKVVVRVIQANKIPESYTHYFDITFYKSEDGSINGFECYGFSKRVTYCVIDDIIDTIFAEGSSDLDDSNLVYSTVRINKDSYLELSSCRSEADDDNSKFLYWYDGDHIEATLSDDSEIGITDGYNEVGVKTDESATVSIDLGEKKTELEANNNELIEYEIHYTKATEEGMINDTVISSSTSHEVESQMVEEGIMVNASDSEELTINTGDIEVSAQTNGTPVMIITSIGSVEVYGDLDNDGNYTDSIDTTVNSKNISLCSIQGIVNKPYTGNPVYQEITVYDEGTLLEEGTDYLLEYINNIDIGTATVKVSGLGSYTGTEEKEFEIVDVSTINHIVLDKETLTLKTGRVVSLNASFEPEDIENPEIEWSSSDSTVVTVDKDGNVTGISRGTATIAASVEDSEASAECVVTVIGGKWMEDRVGWWYQWDDGTYSKSEFENLNNHTYYFNASGYMVTGWQSIDGKWYYFNASGAMMTGWQKLGGVWYYMNSNGAMVTGWQSIGGVWYYFNSSGAMQTGWRQLGGVWYYMNPSGAMVTGWQGIGGKWYYFNAGGAMMTGWQQIGDVWYYMNSSGAMVTGWLKLGNTWYYMNASGAMVTGRQQIDGTWYTFSSSGAMQ